MATCVQHMLKIYKNFTLQHLCYPIEHIYLCLTSIYHILLKLSCPYSWLIKQTKQTTTKTTIKKTTESSVCRPWRGCWQLHWEYKNQPCLCIEILGNFYLIYSCLLNCLFTLKQHLFSTIQPKFFFLNQTFVDGKTFLFFLQVSSGRFMAFLLPNLCSPFLWREYLCTQKASKLLFREGTVWKIYNFKL